MLGLKSNDFPQNERKIFIIGGQRFNELISGVFFSLNYIHLCFGKDLLLKIIDFCYLKLKN